MPRDLPPISRIVLIKLRQNLVGSFASRLADMLESLDTDATVILDLAGINSVDGYGINVIAETLARGVNVYLVGVRGRVRRMFRQARSISESQFIESTQAALDAISRQGQADVPPEAERRASRRIRSHIPVEIILEIDGQRVPTEGIIKNISDGGVYVELRQKLAEVLGDDLDFDTAFDLRFVLPDVSYPCLLQGNAVHGGPTAVGLCYGVKFSEVTYLDEDAIRVFLYHHDPDRRAGMA